MIVFKSYGIGGESVLVGEASKAQEYEELFELRKRVYLKHGYTYSSHKGGSDVDEYDENRTCVYFVACANETLLGSARLIRSQVLPTQLAFEFKTPKTMRIFKPENLTEISRLVVDSQGARNFAIPEYLLMIILIDGIIEYSAESDLYAGYSFVKSSLGRILDQRLHLPIYFIEDFKLVYDGELMRGYFQDKRDPPVPIYYIRAEAAAAVDSLLRERGSGKIENE